MPELMLAEMAHTLLRETEMAVAMFDEADVLRFANEAFVQRFHHQPDGQRTWTDIMRANHAAGQGTRVSGDVDFETWLASARSRRGKQPFRAFEGDLENGQWHWITETTLANGWMLCVVIDTTALHQQGRDLRAMRDRALRAAQTDALTGISNRAYMQQQLAALFVRPNPLVLVMLDLDHFKQINDRHGHPVGDAVLRDFAGHLQAQMRRADRYGRVGGEEFMLLLPDCTMAQAQPIVERLLARARNAVPLPAMPQQRYSVSAGLALRRPGDTAQQLVARADAALYQAKREGRDRLVCAA